MLVEKRGSWIGATRWATSHAVGSLPGHADDWIGKLEELGRRGDGVLISCADRATELLVQRRAEIPPNLRSFESASSAHLSLMDKSSLCEIAEEAGVRYPQTLTLSDRAQLERVAVEAAFPCLIKPVHSHRWRSLFGERRAIVVDGPGELIREATAPLDAGLDLLVSEHIPGPDCNLEGAMTVRCADGAYVLVCGRQKVRMHPPGYGAAAIDESAEVPEAVAMTKMLLGTSGFAGVSSSEIKRHGGTGELYLIEVNVRVPQAWGVTEVARTDGSWRLYATLAGLPLDPQQAQRVGVRNVIPSLEIRAVPTHLAERKLSLREVLDGYRGVRGFSGLTVRDPRPVLRLGRGYVKWLWGHLGSRFLPRRRRHGSLDGR
jgi:D-aspartate ligase